MKQIHLFCSGNRAQTGKAPCRGGYSPVEYKAIGGKRGARGLASTAMGMGSKTKEGGDPPHQ